MLKIAGVKSEKEFYKKFPTEEAFMAKHGKQLKKAAMGKSMVNKQLTQLTDFSNPPQAQLGLGNIAKSLSGFTKMTKNTDGTSSASGGLGSFAADLFGGEGTAKGIMDVGAKGALGAGGKGLAAGAGAAGMGILNAAPAILGGIDAMKEQKTAIKKAGQQTELTGLTADAAAMRPERIKNKYVRPEDSLVQPDQLGSAQGTGTNFLQMKSGGEIQNTYAPGTLYNDLGQIPTAEFGDYFQDSGQAQIGGAAGEAIGNALFGPLGGMAGKFLGKVGGNLLGGAADANELARYQSQTKQNTERLANSGMANSIQTQNASFMKQGGWVSHDWQPQVITKFGEHKMSDLLKPDPTMNTLRSGGHLAQVEYTPPSAEAMFTGRRDLPYQMEDGGYMAMGGALKTHWGGDAELMSYNPYIPGGGETVMFRGQSHDDTNEKGQSGIGITYGDNPVEVERGEPMTEMNGGGTVFGNLLMPGGKTKFKNYVADLSKTEAKQNKIMDKASALALDADENDPFGRLSLNSSQASLIGANMKLKDIAQKKQDAADLQNAILDTADEMGLVADDLAKGKIKEAKFGGKMTAQDGTSLNSFLKTPFAERKKLAKDLGYTDYNGKNVKQQEKLYDLFKSKNTQVYTPPTAVNLTDNRGPNYNWMPTDTTPIVKPTGVKSGFDQYQNYFDASGNLVDQSGDLPGAITPVGVDRKGTDWKDVAQTVLSNAMPLFRPTDQEGLDPSQLYPEYNALANNQLEAVQAQQFQPQLGGVMDVSYQDQLNEITAQSRAAERMMQNNPEAAANLFAQASQAKNKVLAEQTRANMAGRKQVYDENRNLLNQAQLQNLQILDQQYVRQAQAKSATKAQAQSALSSIADKIAKNKLENRQLGVMENMYNYRFDKQGRAFNFNDPAQFNIPDGIGIDNLTSAQIAKIKELNEKIVTKDKAGNVTGSKEKTSSTKTAMNGSIVKALKKI